MSHPSYEDEMPALPYPTGTPSSSYAEHELDVGNVATVSPTTVISHIDEPHTPHRSTGIEIPSPDRSATGHGFAELLS